MSDRVDSVPGTEDIFPEESARWRAIEACAHDVFERYGYGEIRVPLFERTEVFERSIGESTDVVQKEMYTFEDRGGRSLTLRPEGTASVVRAVLGRGLEEAPYRLYYTGPMFRNERPQKGRYRQFHQIGVEAIGGVTAATDAEVVLMLWDLLQELGLRGMRLRLNTVGAPQDRPAVLAAYREAFADRLAAMCEDCRRRYDTNVLRILDCKRDGCQPAIAAAPPVSSVVSPASRGEHERTVSLLRAAGLEPIIEPRLVRGLDYYVHSVYEVVHEGLGAQDAVAGGGRYRISLGGETDVDGSGFALGLERLLLALAAEDALPRGIPPPDVYMVSPGAEDLDDNFRLAHDLRRLGFRVLMDLESRSMKAQMRRANRSGAAVAVIRGGDEREAGVAVVKDMASGDERRVGEDDLAAALRSSKEHKQRTAQGAGDGDKRC